MASHRLEPLVGKKGFTISIDKRFESPENKNILVKNESVGNKLYKSNIEASNQHKSVTRNNLKNYNDSLQNNTSSFTNSFTGKSLKDDLYQIQLQDDFKGTY